MGLMQSAVWVQEVTILGVCKLKTEIAFCSQTTFFFFFFKVPMKHSCGQAQISAEAVSEPCWLISIVQKSFRFVPMAHQSPPALAKPKLALMRTSPRAFLCLSAEVEAGLQVQAVRCRTQKAGCGAGEGVSTV